GNYWPMLSAMVTAGRVVGPRIHDARIAALCQLHGVRELWTTDRDFTRFPGVTVFNPLLDAPVHESPPAYAAHRPAPTAAGARAAAAGGRAGRRGRGAAPARGRPPPPVGGGGPAGPRPPLRHRISSPPSAGRTRESPAGSRGSRPCRGSSAP